jgi:hypothetical protein
VTEPHDDLEPFTGRFDYEEAFRQNPDQPRFDVPNWMRDQDHGRESADDAQVRPLAEETEEWLTVARLDPEADDEGHTSDPGTED